MGKEKTSQSADSLETRSHQVDPASSLVTNAPACACPAFACPGVQAQRSLGFGVRVGSEMKWVANRVLWVPRLDAGVGVVQAVVGGHGRRVGGLVSTLGASIDYLP
jgi:hypothetical protein